MAKNDDYYDYHTDYGGRIHSLYNGEDLGLGLIVIFAAVVLWNWWQVIGITLLFFAGTLLLGLRVEKWIKRERNRNRQFLKIAVVVGVLMAAFIWVFFFAEDFFLNLM